MKETALLYKHKMLRNVINDIHVSINIFDKNGERIFANPHYYFITGKKPGSKIGKKCNPEGEGLRKDHIIDQKVKEALETGKVSEIRNYLYQSRLKKTRNYLDFLIGPLKDEKDTIIGAYTMGRDETSRFLARRKLETLNKNLENIVNERTDKLKKANIKLKKMADSKNMLVSDVAHEIKTILTIIKGNVDMINAQIKSNDPLINECNKEIGNEIFKMSNIISDLVFITKSELYANLFNIEKFDLVKITKEIIKGFEGIAKNKKFKISTAINRPAIYIMADKQKITTLISNMIENSIKYSKEDGGKLKVIIKTTGIDIQLIFTDNGIGIEKEKINHIFDPFFQVNKTNQNKAIHRGFGLGLAICKKIVFAHKGKLSVNSVVGKGTEFTVVFPKT